jgi:hypothetical protein
MLYGFCGSCDVCRSASSVMTTSAATKNLQSCRETIRRMLVECVVMAVLAGVRGTLLIRPVLT